MSEISKKRGKYGKWNEKDMELAIIAYRGGIGLNECQRRYNINKSTLLRHIRGTNKLANDAVKKLGTKNVFHQELEAVLVKHIAKFAEAFFGFTIRDIRRLAFQLAERHMIPHNFNRETCTAGKKWYYGFMRRHPELSLRQPESTSLARAKGFAKDKVNEFYDLLEKIVDTYGISANTIFNVDETGISTVQRKMQKVIAMKGRRQVGGIASGERGVNTTAVCCVNAAGLYVPPMLIFKRKRYTPELSRGAPLGSVCEISDTGYINSELFIKWLKHFYNIVQSGPEKHVLLLLDGHTTHSNNLEALEFAREHNIHFLQLPAHTTHRLQPLDVAFFKPLKTYYVQAQDSWLRSHTGQGISAYDVAELFAESYGRAATVKIAENAFRAPGIWPVNRNFFPEHFYAPSRVLESGDNTLNNETGEHLQLLSAQPGTSRGLSATKDQTIFTDSQLTILKDPPPTSQPISPINSHTTFNLPIPLSPNPQSLGVDSAFKTSETPISPIGSMTVNNSLSTGKKTLPNVCSKNGAQSSESTASTSKGVLSEISPNTFYRSLDVVCPFPKSSGNSKTRTSNSSSAVELTSSPYKEELTLKKRKQEEASKRKSERKPKYANVQKATKNLFKNNVKKQQTKKTKKSVIDPHETDDKGDSLCLYCHDLYSNSKSEEGWAMCQACFEWAHEACAGVEEDDEEFICDVCKSL